MGGVLRRGFPGVQMALFAGVCLGLAGLQIGQPPCRAVSEASPAENPEPPRAAKWGLPFSAADVVRYFADALGVPPRRGDGSVVFENGGDAPEGERDKIIVAQEDREVVVSFAVAGDSGMSMVREFIESPLFESSEREQLHKLVEESQGAPTRKLERFSVAARGWHTSDRFHLVLRFFRPGSPVRL